MPGVGPGRLIEQRQGAREIVIRIRGDQAGGLGSSGRGSVTRIAAARVCFTLGAYLGLARKVSSRGPGLLHAGHAGDFDARVAVQFAAELGRQIAQANPLDGGHNQWLDCKPNGGERQKLAGGSSLPGKIAAIIRGLRWPCITAMTQRGFSPSTKLGVKSVIAHALVARAKTDSLTVAALQRNEFTEQRA